MDGHKNIIIDKAVIIFEHCLTHALLPSAHIIHIFNNMKFCCVINAVGVHLKIMIMIITNFG